MRIYVGATFSRYLEVREIIDALRAAGHEITHDWTRTRAFEADGHPTPNTGGGYDLDRADAAAHAIDDIGAVQSADLLLMLGQEASCGWPIEVGIALAGGSASVWLVAPFKWTVFWALPQVRTFESVAEPLIRLGADWR